MELLTVEFQMTFLCHRIQKLICFKSNSNKRQPDIISMVFFPPIVIFKEEVIVIRLSSTLRSEYCNRILSSIKNEFSLVSLQFENLSPTDNSLVFGQATKLL